ncbi:PadR family transcriptional regulator [Nocardia otitidiscaviarum]|uniref:PadR family transcriptional regulator n=1 Tax=Nocardia otitidiscaviarum TaxID=1823 RepID=UPI000693E376|nr:PadR family transcriptional regulator [Nocardia otitidiscaviarum]
MSIWHPFQARAIKAHRRIAAVLLALPDDHHYGYPLSRRAGVSPGSMYPVLTRMLRDGWLTDGWETPEPEDRPARRWYQLTEVGHRELTAMLRAIGGRS